MAENGYVRRGAKKAHLGAQNGSKMVKTGLKWLKTTQNVSKTCFYDFLEKFIFRFFDPEWPKMAKSRRGQMGQKGPFGGQNGSKMVKTGLKWPKTTQNVSKTVFL
jgi:hypothetical protein